MSNVQPTWSADGEFLTDRSVRPEGRGLYVRRSNGTGDEMREFHPGTLGDVGRPDGGVVERVGGRDGDARMTAVG